MFVYCAEWMNNTEVDFPKLLFLKVPKFQHQQVAILFQVFIIPVSSIISVIYNASGFSQYSLISLKSYMLFLLILNGNVINPVQVASVPLSQVF